MLFVIYYNHYCEVSYVQIKQHPLLTCNFLQYLQNLLLLLQRDRIRDTPVIMKAILRQPVKLIPPDTEILQRPRKSQFSDNSIKDISQVCAGGINTPTLQDVRNFCVLSQDAEYWELTVDVCALFCVVFADGGKENAACFAVSDTKWTELYDITNVVSRGSC